MDELIRPEQMGPIGQAWRIYASQYAQDGEYEIDDLVRFVVRAWLAGYVVDVDDVADLVASSGIRWENEDKIADEVDAITATLRLLEAEFGVFLKPRGQGL